MQVIHNELSKHLQYHTSHKTYNVKNIMYIYNEITLLIIQHKSYTMYTKMETFFFYLDGFDP